MATKKKKKPAATTKKASKKKPSKKPAKKPAKKAAKKAPAKKAAKKPAKKATQKAAKKTAKPAKKAAKKPAKKAAPKKASSSSTATLVQHVFVAATPAQVYRALTDPTEHGAFTGTVVTGEPVEGGTFTASSGYIQGTFEKLEANKLVVQTWKTTEWPKGAAASRLELSLEDAGDGTELTMTHSEVPTSQAENYRQGWIDYYWTPLRAHFASKG
ncbi:MAG: SRPBCC domain-containing protein [Deltaproteobacteria bacterium]|nr:SRPBCC domain-containing protein [Deltaproteobacteria bacterium]